MAIFQPAFALQRVGADWTITAAVTGDVSAFAMRAIFRDQIGSSGTTWATKTTGGGGIVATHSGGTTSVVITLEDTDTDLLTPGAYVWKLERTDSGAEFDLIDWSTVLLTPTTDSATPQLTNLSELIANSRGILSETVSDTDAKYYLQLLAAAETVIRHHCGRKFSYGTYTEYKDAPVRGNLWATELPIDSITSIKFDSAGGFGQLTNTFGSDTALTAGTDYFYREDRPDGLGYSGEIFTTRPGGWSWWGYGGRLAQPWGLLASRQIAIPGAFQIVYTAGYRLIPADLKAAVWNLVAQYAQRTAKGTPLQSESGMNYSYSLAAMESEATRIDSVQATIAAYRRGDMYVG